MFDIRALLEFLGYAGLAGVIFAESGLLIGFFFPGDSLLFTAGFLASQGIFSIVPLALLCFCAATAGDSVGYAFGRRVGRKIFTREESLFFRRSNLLRAERFFARHGGKTLILARFLPAVRTFVPILAGVGVMRYRRFFFYNVAGAFLWAIGLTVLGYLFGNIVSDVDRYLLPVIVGIVALSVLPSAWHVLRNAEHRARLFLGVRNFTRRLVFKGLER